MSQWADQSGNGNHLAQPSGSLQPTLVTGQNSLAALRFSNAQWLQKAFTLGKTNTVLLCYKSIVVGAAASHDTIFDGLNGFSNAFGVDSTTPRTFIYNGTLVSNAHVVANTVYAYVTVQFNGASSFVRENGTQLFSGNPNNTLDPSGYTLGSSGGGTRGANVEVSEVIVYNRVLATSEILMAENYLKSRYAL